MSACIVAVAGFEMMARAQEEEISRESTTADGWVTTGISVLALVPAVFVVYFYSEAFLLWLHARGVCTCVRCPTSGIRTKDAGLQLETGRLLPGIEAGSSQMQLMAPHVDGRRVGRIGAASEGKAAGGTLK